jgi:hypothetical protein
MESERRLPARVAVLECLIRMRSGAIAGGEGAREDTDAYDHATEREDAEIQQ